MTLTRRTLIAASMAAATLVAPQSASANPTDGPILLTVTGAVERPNRGGYDPDTDKFFGYNEVIFDKAREFDFDDLAGLTMVRVKADFPKGRQIHEYEGPLLADVLEAAGATGQKLIVQALDGYAIEVPLEEVVANGAVVAMKRNGKMFGIGDFGPTQIVFPRAERSDLANMSDDQWIWSIFHINVR